MVEERIKLLLIYEILGRPPEHIKQSLESLIDQIGQNPGIKILSKKVHEPHPVEEEKLKKMDQKVDNIFSTFAEVEIEVNNLAIVFKLILNTLPSNIEILEPSELRLKNFDLSGVLAELTVKLHQFDEVAKALTLEKNHLVKIIKELDEKLGGGHVKFETSSVDLEKEEKQKEAEPQIDEKPEK